MSRSSLTLLFASTLASMALYASPALAVPSYLAAQGYLRTTGGTPASDGKYGLIVSLYDSSTATKPFWKESLVGVSVQSGLFAVTLGMVDENNPLPAAKLVASPEVWLGLSVEGEAELPRSRLVSAAYALAAGEAGHAAAADELTKLVSTDMLAAGSATAEKVGFTFAGSDAKGGDALIAKVAQDLDCTACVSSAELADGAVLVQHVTFNYAGSQSKGGKADGALLADAATTADKATLADKALLADSATSADKATLADAATLADLAKAVDCTGCIGLTQLAPDVANGFLPITGGKLTGSLEMTKGWKSGGDADMGFNLLANARLPIAGTAPAVCDTSKAGYLWFDSSKSLLMFCDGTKYRAFQPMSTAGLTQADAGASCKDLLAKGQKADGAYWIDTDGGDTGNAFQVFCDMTTDNGGWTLVLKQASNSGYGSVLSVAVWKGWNTKDQTIAPTDATVSDTNMVNLAYSRLSGVEMRMTASKTWTSVSAGAWSRTINGTAYDALSDANANKVGNTGGSWNTPWPAGGFTDNTWTQESNGNSLCWRSGPWFNQTSFEYTSGGVKWGWFFNNECGQSTTDTAEGLGCCGNGGWYRKSPWALYLWVR